MTSDLRFTAEDWARTERDWTAWWAGELDRPLVVINDFVPPEKPLPQAHLFTATSPWKCRQERW